MPHGAAPHLAGVRAPGAERDSESTRPHRWRDGSRIFVAPVAANIATTMPLMLLGATAVQLRHELDIDAAQLGFAASCFSVGGATTALLGGRLSEDLGPEGSLRLTGALSALIGLGIALFAHSFASLIVLIAVAGTLQPLAQSASNLYLVQRSHADRLGFALGLKQAAMPASSLVCGLSVPALAVWAGWRATYLVGMAIAVAAMFAVPHRRQVKPHRLRRSQTASSGTGPLIVLACAAACGSVAGGALATFYIDAATSAGLSNLTAAVLLAGGSILSIIARIRSGLRADRRRGRHLEVVAKMQIIGGVLLLPMCTGNALAFAAVAPFAFSFAWGWTGLFQLAVIESNRHAPGRATGVVQTGTLLGAVLGPVAFGLTVRHGSYAAAWAGAAALSIASAALMLIGRRALATNGNRATAT